MMDHDVNFRFEFLVQSKSTFEYLNGLTEQKTSLKNECDWNWFWKLTKVFR